MKYAIIFIFGFMLMQTAKAQDVIVKKTGDEIKARVLEITTSEIKYKRFDNLEGPTIYIAKSDVFMIRYENGTKDVFNETPKKQEKQEKPVENKAEEKTHEPDVKQGGDNPIYEPIRLNGPRVGLTFIGPGPARNALKDRFNVNNPVFSQFGWQFETKFFTTEHGLSGMVEFIPLIGGVEQGVPIPSATGIIGLRGRSGFEVGVGPNISPSGGAVVLAIGTSLQSSGVNFPVNFAVTTSKEGMRFSLLAGFNIRKR